MEDEWVRIKEKIVAIIDTCCIPST